MKVSALLSILIALLLSGPAIAGQPVQEPQNDWVDYYLDRYQLDDAYEKLVGNRGNGFEDLYGTRNMRMVLKGILYRGGGNNYYHRTDKRDNRNPLPEDGLENLCQEGFGRVVYLYSRNFDTASHLVRCRSVRSSQQELDYLQRSPLNTSEAYDMLEMVFENIQDYRYGPMYFHCWNGWHASGLISAYVLRQFCGVSAEKAVQYWDANTDGVNESPRYERIRERIRDFVPYPEFQITKAQQARYCPEL